MFWTYLKLKLNRRLLKRFGVRKTKVLNFTVHYNDTRSLFSEFKNIFIDKIYHFTSANPTPTIIDGGGHIGLSTLYFKHIYPSAKITIFEPDAVSLEMLRKNIGDNKLSDITLVESGLYSSDKKVSFIANQTDASKITEAGNQEIPVERLSKYITSEVDFMKLNIEGSELEVLTELQQSGKLSNIKEMCIEWHSFSRQSQNLGELLTILEKNNYKYLINHFDYRVNKVLKPPFKVEDKTQYYLLVYAKRKS